MEITTQELAAWLSTGAGILIDTRPLEAYNGWPLRQEYRGGHIQGAKSLPLKWSQYIDFKDILDIKGITPDQPLLLYGYEPEGVNRFARKMQESGYNQIAVYHHFTDEWASNPDLPMDRLERHRQLVYPQWVNSLINGQQPLGYEGNDFVICHAHYGFAQDYHDGHIPGAIPLNTNDLESPETWNRRSPEELEKNLVKNGISHDTTVVMYGRFAHPDNKDPYPGQAAGHLGAIRCAAILMYAGVKDVKILNGGLSAWREAGMEISREPVHPKAKSSFGASIPGRPEIFIDTPEAKALLTSEKGELVSIRSWDEFTGKVSGYNYIDKKGRIPGAIFGNCGSDAYHMENYRNLDHTMREFHEIQAEWKENDIVPEKHIAFYCGTGWRGSEAFMNAYLMGWPKVSVYDGGWFEWSSDPDNPVGVGEAGAKTST